MAYNLISLEDMYKALGEERTKLVLKEFECDLNKDVEYFIKEKAIEFLKMNVSRTFLVSTQYRKKDIIVGYFSLANKVTRIKRNVLSGTMRKKLGRYAEKVDSSYYIFSLPLIGQLGKNFKNGYNTH